MTPKAPRVTAAEVSRALTKVGFELTRQSGAHAIYVNKDGRRTTVPIHGKKILHPKILASILRDSGLSVDELERLRK